MVRLSSGCQLASTEVMADRSFNAALGGGGGGLFNCHKTDVG